MINREILRLAIPNIVSNISIPLLSTVDTALMGNLSPNHLGAVGIGAMIFNFIYWNFGFLRMGTTGMTDQAYGAKDDSAVNLILMRSMADLLMRVKVWWENIMEPRMDHHSEKRFRFLSFGI